MSIRKDALENKAFMQMKAVYDNREAVVREWKAQGKKVIGTLGYDVPEELVMAAGMMSYGIYADNDQDLSGIDRYLEFSFPPAVRGQFAKIIDGSDKELMDYLVIGNSTDVMVRIYYYIREVKALEPERNVPELYFIDWLFTKYRMHQLRNETIISDFRKQLEVWSGKEITDSAIKEASEICNENRTLLERISHLRKEGHITGSEALIIIGSSMYMEKQKHSELLKELLTDAADWEKTALVKVFVTGSAHEHADFYEMLEDAGMTAVSEDHDWGDRYWNKATDTKLTPVKGIVDRYMLRSAGVKRSFVSERVKEVCDSVEKCGAQGMILYTHDYDDAPSWDFPEQSKALAEMNVKTMQLSRQQYDVKNNPEIPGLLQAFCNEIKEG